MGQAGWLNLDAWSWHKPHSLIFLSDQDKWRCPVTCWELDYSISTNSFFYHFPVCVWDAFWCLLDWSGSLSINVVLCPSCPPWLTLQNIFWLIKQLLQLRHFSSSSSSLTKGFSSSAKLQLPSQSTKSSNSSLSSITSNTKHAESSGMCHFRSMLMWTVHLSAISIS